MSLHLSVSAFKKEVTLAVANFHAETLRLMTQLTISKASQLLRDGELSPVELTEACLNQIDRLNPTLNAFITVTPEDALEAARTAEQEIEQGQWRGPLHGIPIGLKDIFDTAWTRTTCGSALFADRVPTEDAFVVQRLKEAGAVIVGKQNMQEFAWGGTSASSHFGPVRNPWDTGRISGGSSGGSAVAVATGMCLGALGTDTGGSVRQPASFCGIVGLKPTYGRVSSRGVYPLSWSLDHVGPLSRTVEDAALMLEVIAGYDSQDPTSVDWPNESFAEACDREERYRIGVVRDYFFDGIDTEVEALINDALKVVSELAVDVIEVRLPDTPALVQAPEVLAVHADDFAESPNSYRDWMQKRLKQAQAIDTVSYVNARRKLESLRRNIGKVFSKVDLLVTPTVRVPPITIDEALAMTEPPPAGELWLFNTRPFNAYGLPTISIPCGFTSKSLPVGLQIAGPRFGEGKVLAFASAFERATEWHTRFPSL